MEPEKEVSIEMKEAHVEETETWEDELALHIVHNGGETEKLVGKVYYDRRETKERFDKIVEIFKKRGTDEPESGSSAEISVETMKFVIKCLDTTKNPFHSFMNVITVKRGNYNYLIKELEELGKKRPGFISLDEFSEYTATKEKEENKLRWWYCCDGDPGKGNDHKGKLIDYFFGIATAQKVKVKPSAIFFPLFTLLLLLIHMVEPHFELKSMLQFDM